MTLTTALDRRRQAGKASSYDENIDVRVRIRANRPGLSFRDIGHVELAMGCSMLLGSSSVVRRKGRNGKLHISKAPTRYVSPLSRIFGNINNGITGTDGVSQTYTGTTDIVGSGTSQYHVQTHSTQQSANPTSACPCVQRGGDPEASVPKISHHVCRCQCILNA